MLNYGLDEFVVTLKWSPFQVPYGYVIAGRVDVVAEALKWLHGSNPCYTMRRQAIETLGIGLG